MDNQIPIDRIMLPASTIPLDDAQGLAGPVLSECVDRNGVTSFWILVSDEESSGCACRDHSPHEQAGVLPTEWKRKLGLECGAKTRNGSPCKTLVSSFGERCNWHTDAPEEGKLF